MRIYSFVKFPPKKRQASLLFIVLLLLVLISCSGCASWTKIHQTPILSHDINPQPSSQGAGRVPAFLTDYRVTLNGTETTVKQDFVNRIVVGLNRTGLFSTVKASPVETSHASYIDFSLSVDEMVDSHQGMNALKGGCIGGSFFLLTPILPLSVDFGSAMTLHAKRSDGQERNYSASCKGTAKFHFFANAALAGQDVGAKVTGANINSLLNQVLNDASFYQEER